MDLKDKLTKKDKHKSYSALQIWEEFINNSKMNNHLIINVSPVGEK